MSIGRSCVLRNFSLLAVAQMCVFSAQLTAQPLHSAESSSRTDLAAARQELAAKHYGRAKQLYRAYLHAHPESADAELGVADTELALHEYEAAEVDYRRVVAAQPQLWVAHKNWAAGMSSIANVRFVARHASVERRASARVRVM
jgi:tetratricopeptide (TPR) repeat protein